MESESWYGVRTHYEWMGRSSGQDRLFEERILIFRANSHEDAISKAEIEAIAYSSEEIRYLGLVQAFEMDQAEPAEGSEVYSLLRESRMQPDRYLTKFFDTGRERSC